jgi:uncharacterized protein (TIGR03437 family)
VVSTGNGSLTQNGNSVTAEFIFSGTPCAASASGTGTLSGTSLTMNLNEGGQIVAFTGTVSSDGNSANGNYQAPQGGCLQGDFGTFTGVRLPAIGTGGVVNGASFGTQSPAAGSIGSLFGTALASATTAAASLPLPTSLGGVSVRINNIAVPLFFVSAGQINFQFPWELTGVTSASATVTARGSTSSSQTVRLAAAGPGIFSTNSQGTGQGAIQIANTVTFAAPAGSIAGVDARPVKRGEFLTIYCTGLGDVDVRPANGAGAPANPVANTKTRPTVTIGAVDAPVSFAGLSPGFVALYQVNVQVPANAPSGAAVQVVVTSGGVASNAVTIAVE